MVTKVGLDLGYANITLSDVTAGIYREPSVALVDKDTRRILSIGESASSGVDESSVNVENGLLVRPFKNGLLFDHEITRGVVEHAVKGMLPKGPLGREMYTKLFVYAGPEHKHEAQKPEIWNF